MLDLDRHFNKFGNNIHLDARKTVPICESLTVTTQNNLPNVDAESFREIDEMRLLHAAAFDHPARILFLYGSVRKRAFSRLASEEAACIARRLGAETRLFDPSGLPLPDDADPDHLKVQELRDLVVWFEGMVWCSPERHGAMTGIMKAQID